jgi:hypothetical protein
MAANAVSRQATALNLGNGERAGALIGGMALIVRAVSQPSLGRIAAAVGGAMLLQWGISGYRRVHRPVRHDRRGRRVAREDPVLLASEDSFPASDPPSWTPVMGSAAGSGGAEAAPRPRSIVTRRGEPS